MVPYNTALASLVEKGGMESLSLWLLSCAAQSPDAVFYVAAPANTAL
jgi:hypothetical protein